MRTFDATRDEHEDIMGRLPHGRDVMMRSEIVDGREQGKLWAVSVGNRQEEDELLDSLMWRSATTMPVLKVLRYKTQSRFYPKVYNVEVEHIKKSVENLQNLPLQDCLHLIQQCVQGIQALTSKYPNFDFHKIFYGLTQHNICKVWVSRDLGSPKSPNLPLPNQDIIIVSVIKMVISLSDCQGGMKLQELLRDVGGRFGVGFWEFWGIFGGFCRRIGVEVGTSLGQVGEVGGLGLGGVRRANSLESKSLYRVNFRYESPLPRCFGVKERINENMPKYIQKPSKTQYEAQQTTSSSNKPKPKPLSSMLSSPNKLKQKLKQCKDTPSLTLTLTSTPTFTITPATPNPKQSPPISTSIKIIESSSYLEVNEEKSEKTSTSLTINGGDWASVRDLYVGSQCGLGSNRNSLVLSGMEQGFSQRIDKSSILVSQTQSKYTIHNNDMLLGVTKYNFGGLLPLAQHSIKQSQQIDEQFLQSPNLHPCHPPHIPQTKSFLDPSPSLAPWITNAWDWQNKMTKLLTQQTHNLKESIHCGEEKKPEPLQIRLEKLGRLGREITSFIPENCQN